MKNASSVIAYILFTLFGFGLIAIVVFVLLLAGGD